MGWELFFYVPFWLKLPVLIPEAPRAYSGSSPCLFRKRLALIAEAQGAYFGSPWRFPDLRHGGLGLAARKIGHRGTEVWALRRNIFAVFCRYVGNNA